MVFLDGYIEVMGIALAYDEYEAFNYHACYVLGEECWNAMKPEYKIEIIKRFKNAEG